MATKLHIFRDMTIDFKVYAARFKDDPKNPGCGIRTSDLTDVTQEFLKIVVDEKMSWDKITSKNAEDE